MRVQREGKGARHGEGSPPIVADFLALVLPCRVLLHSGNDTATDTQEGSAAMADYDSPWKEMLDGYFPAFMAFFFPAAAAEID